MTGVQLAEARTVTGSGDFTVAPSGSLAAAGATVTTTDPITSSPATSSPAVSPSAAAPAVGATSSADPTGVAPAAPDPTDPPTSDPVTTAADTVSPAPVSPAPIVAGIPVGLHFPRLDVRAPIDPVGMSDGELDVPEDVTRLGWWTGSTAAGGSTGTTVVDGHIDSPQGRGVFYHLQEVEPDDQVELTVAGGSTVTYRVTERRSYHKADGLPPEVFESSDQPRLVLITCGGRFDFAKASYDDNIVVIAVPA